MADYVYRIHPAIGIARVGNSEEYYIGPETAAGVPIPKDPRGRRGGLPINPETNELISDGDLRDTAGAFKRQAARFRIFEYREQDLGRYPCGQGSEIVIGSTVNGKKVKDIIWTAHVANKKANWYVLSEDASTTGFLGYEGGKTPPVRNKDFFLGGDPNNPARITALTIDPGPRTISGADSGGVKFDMATTASFYAPGAGIKQLGDYPKSFPDEKKLGGGPLFCPAGPIDTLGELRTDAQGRLLVLGGYGRACGWGKHELPFDVNNDEWFDDASDGPVSAVLVLEDDSAQPVQAGAWVVTTDPSYAPQIPNVVSLWDDIYDTWVRNLGLAPDLFDKGKSDLAGGAFNQSYQPSFPDQLYPIFQSVMLQQWVINLQGGFVHGHNTVGGIRKDTYPKTVHPPLISTTQTRGIMRSPDEGPDERWSEGRLMPAALGDPERFLAVSRTQYFFLQQWQKDSFNKDHGPALGFGENLDKVVMQNCLGGRFSPGIDLSFNVRDPDLYVKDWRISGPFRIKPKPLGYDRVQAGTPLLTAGYVPCHTGNTGAEPGDISKFMAIPWHTDYNSCATHPRSSNPVEGERLYWSWPAQRPVAVYPAKLYPPEKAPDPTKDPTQLWSVRGPGTGTDDPDLPAENWGRYQRKNEIDIITNWWRIGVVLQGAAINNPVIERNYKTDVYLEVESQLGYDEKVDYATKWPNKVGQTKRASRDEPTS